MTIGERIKKVRKEKDLTQQAFCEQIGLKRNSISLVESGKRNISDQAIKSICREFNISEPWLRTGEGEMFVEVPMEDQIYSFMADVLKGEPDFKRRFISVLARMTPGEWAILEKKAWELVDEIKKADPEGSADD